MISRIIEWLEISGRSDFHGDLIQPVASHIPQPRTPGPNSAPLDPVWTGPFVLGGPDGSFDSQQHQNQTNTLFLFIGGCFSWSSSSNTDCLQWVVCDSRTPESHIAFNAIVSVREFKNDPESPQIKPEFKLWNGNANTARHLWKTIQDARLSSPPLYFCFVAVSEQFPCDKQTGCKSVCLFQDV